MTAIDSLQLSLFDYAALDTETRIVVQQRTTEIKALMKRAASDIIEIGQKLIEVKARLGHGQFTGWFEAELGLERTMATKFIQVAERFGAVDMLKISTFAPSALYLLAAPSTPDSARTEALERAAQGEPITHQAAREIVSLHRPPREIVVPPTAYNTSLIGDGLDDAYDPPMEPEQVADLKAGEIAGRIVPADTAERPMKPKVNRAGSLYEPRGFDACQTPSYAIDPLIPYLPVRWTIWEPACGEGHLVDAFADAGRVVVASDIIQGCNFFEHEPETWDCLITNPPYSIKYPWLERCYALGRPFALLLPVETLGAQRAQALFVEHGVQIILLDKRINFKMPNVGWEGSSAQFPVAWFTWGFELETQIVFAKLRGEEAAYADT